MGRTAVGIPGLFGTRKSVHMRSCSFDGRSSHAPWGAVAQASRGEMQFPVVAEETHGAIHMTDLDSVVLFGATFIEHA